MIKKNRKKKEIEEEKYDILQIDKFIKNKIKSESENLNNYKKRAKEIICELDKEDLKNMKKKQLEEEEKNILQKIKDIEENTVFLEYVCKTQNLISEYTKINNIPISNSFFSKKKECPENECKKEELLEKFLDIAKQYIEIKTYKKEIQTKIVCDCGNSSRFIYFENKITCELCGIETDRYTIQTNFKDIDRVNLSQKYKYSKKIYFRDTVNRYEGKQNKKIDKVVYDNIDVWFDKHNLLFKEGKDFYEQHKNITKHHVYMALSETGNNLHYEDINLIHNQFTNISCPEIPDDIREKIFEDFDRIMDVYEKLNIERINSLNSQYILYQLLRRRKIKVNENDFGMLKTRDRLIEYDEVYEKICDACEFNFQASC